MLPLGCCGADVKIAKNIPKRVSRNNSWNISRGMTYLASLFFRSLYVIQSQKDGYDEVTEL